MQQQFHTLCDFRNILVAVEFSPFLSLSVVMYPTEGYSPELLHESNNWSTVGPQYSILSFILMVYLTLSWFLNPSPIKDTSLLQQHTYMDMPWLLKSKTPKFPF